jgi:hypothetical protein
MTRASHWKVSLPTFVGASLSFPRSSILAAFPLVALGVAAVVCIT